MMLAQIETAVNAGSSFIDHANSMSDRWLFLATDVALIVGAAICIRWLVASLSTKDALHAAQLTAREAAASAEREKMLSAIREEHLECRAARKEDQTQFISTLDKKDASMSANTEALKTLTASVLAMVNRQERHQ